MRAEVAGKLKDTEILYYLATNDPHGNVQKNAINSLTHPKALADIAVNASGLAYHSRDTAFAQLKNIIREASESTPLKKVESVFFVGTWAVSNFKTAQIRVQGTLEQYPMKINEDGTFQKENKSRMFGGRRDDHDNGTWSFEGEELVFRYKRLNSLPVRDENKSIYELKYSNDFLFYARQKNGQNEWVAVRKGTKFAASNDPKLKDNAGAATPPDSGQASSKRSSGDAQNNEHSLPAAANAEQDPSPAFPF
jgi:hypothetical protein